MATSTNKYKLTKPELSEKVQVEILNANMDLIDLAMNDLQNQVTANKTKADVNTQNLSNHISNTNNPHNVTKEQLNLGNVENKSSATIRGELTKNNVTGALGYTPYTPNEIDNKLSALETNNAIPKATDSIDGLLSKEDHLKYEDAYNKKHTHNNKSILDGITAALISAWNSAVEHISDTVKHITLIERTAWNAAKTHADSTHARVDATKVEKSETNGNIKINGTETNVYTPPSDTIDISGKINKSGDTMTGALNFANKTWNNIGDDVAIGDHNVSGGLGIKGLNGNTRLDFVSKDGANYKSITYDGANLNIDGNAKSAFNGITDSITSTASDVAASAAAVKALNDKITQLNSNLHNFDTIVVKQTGTNLDDYTKTGIYNFGSSYTPINIPVGVNGWLLVFGTSSANTVKQLWFRHGTANSNDYNTFVRTKTSGTWSNWTRIITEKDISNSLVLAYPIIKQYYGSIAIANGEITNTQNLDATGVVFQIPWPCDYIEFTFTTSTYGQYGVCTVDAILPDIQTTGAGRGNYKTYTKPGTYRFNISGVAASHFFITLNQGTLCDIKIKMLY